MIGQINLKGIIISPEGMLAIIENGANRTYFLRVNDPLFDGMVERITRDSITFRENVSDSLGRPLGTREVVKKIVAPAV
jgi:Tfp pilus assembly protein PilP